MFHISFGSISGQNMMNFCCMFWSILSPYFWAVENSFQVHFRTFLDQFQFCRRCFVHIGCGKKMTQLLQDWESRKFLIYEHTLNVSIAKVYGLFGPKGTSPLGVQAHCGGSLKYNYDDEMYQLHCIFSFRSQRLYGQSQFCR